MKYLVMECGLSYAIVLDEQGRFLKAANLNYQVGQQLDSIIPLKVTKQRTVRLRSAISLAAVACLCLVSMLVFQFIIFPVGTIRMTINPDVAMKVNRLHYVVGLEGLNQDGEKLIEGVEYSWKKVEEVSDQLAERAVSLGYLAEGGKIQVSVESEDAGWKTATEEMVVAELEIHFEHEIVIVVGDDDDDDEDDDDDKDDDSSKAPPQVTAKPSEKPEVTPSPKASPSPTIRPDDKDDDDDDDDNKDDDSDDDDDDDDDSDDDDDDDEKY